MGKRWRYEQDKAHEYRRRERTVTYVTKTARSTTKPCKAYTPFAKRKPRGDHGAKNSYSVVGNLIGVPHSLEILSYAGIAFALTHFRGSVPS